MNQINFPNIENYDNQQLLGFMKDYQKLNKGNEIFFIHKNLEITFKDVDKIINNKITNQVIWLFLLDFLVVYSYSFKHSVAMFSFYHFTKVVDIQKNQYEMIDLSDKIDQDDEGEEKQIILIQLGKEYFLILYYREQTYIVTYTQFDEQVIQFIVTLVLKNVNGDTKILGDYLGQDYPHLLFYFLTQFISLHKPEHIELTEYDLKTALNRELWLIFAYAFRYINQLYSQEESQQQNYDKLLEFKQNQLKSQLKKQRKDQLDSINNIYRLPTPKTLEELHNQEQYLNERLAYLKVQNGVGNDDDILKSEMFQIRSKQMHLDIDKELEKLDFVKQQEINYRGSSMQLVRNASEILKGKFNSMMFQGLGLEIPQTNNKKQILNELQKANYERIINPVLERKQEIPGEFIPKQKVKNIVAVKNKVYVTKEELQDFRNNSVSISIVNYYSKFLEEFTQLSNENYAFMLVYDFNDIYSEIQCGKTLNQQLYKINYLAQYEKIIFPIKINETQEYSLIVIDVQELKIYHYYLLSQKIKTSANALQQIYKSWNINVDQELKDKLNKQELQDRILKIIIYWIRRLGQIYNFNQDMKLWKIRIQDIDTVSTSSESAYYLLTIMSCIVVKKQKIDNIKLINIVKDVVEHAVCMKKKNDKDISVYQYLLQRLKNN